MQNHSKEYERILVESNETEKKKEEEACPMNKDKMVNIKKAMIKFIVKERLPISKLESLHFNNLINGTYALLIFHFVQLVM